MILVEGAGREWTEPCSLDAEFLLGVTKLFQNWVLVLVQHFMLKAMNQTLRNDCYAEFYLYNFGSWYKPVIKFQIYTRKEWPGSWNRSGWVGSPGKTLELLSNGTQLFLGDLRLRWLQGTGKWDK